MARKTQRVQQKFGQQEREYHSCPDMRDCVIGSNHGTSLYLFTCGTLELPKKLSTIRYKTPIQEQGCNVAATKAVEYETEAGKKGASQMVVERMNIMQHNNACEVNIAVQPLLVTFPDAIPAADTSGSLLVTGLEDH